MEYAYQFPVCAEQLIMLNQSLQKVVGSDARVGRRELLRIGSLAGLGLSLPTLFANSAPAATKAKTVFQKVARSCILIWLDGGPSHIDTFDPKPNAAREVRGPFNAIQTRLPGIEISELFPELACRMDQVSLVRSVTSPLGEHNLGAQYMLTGYQPSPVLAYPPLISVLSEKMQQQASLSLPHSIAVPNFDVGGGIINGHGFLPASTAPFSLNADPATADFKVNHLALPDSLTANRLRRRAEFRQLLQSNTQRDPLMEQAFSVLSSSEAEQAFDLTREPQQIRSRYGPRTIGQSCLLARRLIEAGVRLVTVVQHGWDTHADLITRLKDGYTGAKVPVGLGPSLDQALSALIDDLIDKDLYEETCIVVMGEFGRTPKWNPAGGRDHWPRVFSVLFAGGPFKRGMVYGASDAQGESPDQDAVTPADLAHTIYTAMGIDSEASLSTPDGRTVRLANERAKVIEQLLTYH